MKHIDIDAIRQDPTARFSFLADFCEFSNADWVVLDESLPHVVSALPDVLDRLYDHLLEYDDTRRVFLGERGHLDPAYIELRKEHMTEWIMRTISPGSAAEFAHYLTTVGDRHTGADGDADRKVPPRYMVALMSFIQSAMLGALFEVLADDIDMLRRSVLAWNKILMIQLEMFLHVLAPHWPHWDEGPAC